MTYCTPSSLMALAVCFLNIPTLLLILRLVVRRIQKFAYGIDDWLIIPAWLFLVAICINTIVGVAYERLGLELGSRQVFDWGNGDVMSNDDWVSNDRIAQADQFYYVLQVLQPGALAFAKLSVLFFYRRMLCPESLGPFHKLTKIAIMITAIWGVIFTFLYIFQCGTYFDQIWNPTQAITCFSSPLEISFTGTDALLDIVILILPIRKIMSLGRSNSETFAIMGAFGVGGLTTAASIVRLAITSDLASGDAAVFTSNDEAMTASVYIYWGLFEIGTAVIVACLPTLQYIFRKFLPQKVFKTGQSAKGSGSKTSASPYKSAERLEKASVITESSLASRSSDFTTPIPNFSSRPGTPALEHPPPLPETPAASFSGFGSRTVTLTSDRPTMASGTETPVSVLTPQFHKRASSLFKSFGGPLISPVSRTGSVNSQTPFIVTIEH